MALIGFTAALVAVTGCGETTVSALLPAATIQAVGTAALQGPAGAVLPTAIEIRVLGSDNQPLPAVAVAFSAGQGGLADPANATTDANGIARTQWKLGPTAGANVLTVTAASGASATFTATATASRAATVSVAAGNNQTAPINGDVAIAPSVRVADAFGNLVQNAVVTFSVLSGSGRVTNAVRSTNAQGIATVGSWTLGPAAGDQTLLARVEESGVANNPVIFTATATAAGAQMVATAGNNQQAPVGQLVPVAPTVAIRTASGVGVPGVVVTFTVASGGGNVVASRQVTDASGAASVGGWFLGPLPGTNTLTASSPGLADVTFTATGTAGSAVTMVAVSQTTQSAPAGANVADPPSVAVRDAQGTPVPGVAVTFTVTAGGGTLVGASATTNANGVASVTSWTLGAALGANSVTATASGLPSVTFNATSTAGAPANVTAFLGDNQTALQATPVAIAPTVRVTDAGGNAVLGATVTFAVTQGNGSATNLIRLTDTQGLAAVGSWTLGSGSLNTLTATVTGSGIIGNPVVFTAQSATQLAITGAPTGPLTLGSDFTVTAQLRNAAGVAVALPGISVTIAIASGGGTLNGTVTRVTDASGAVSFTLINVTGSAGARTFSVSSTGLSSATSGAITFN